MAISTSNKDSTLEVIPDPVSLMESMRAVGYTAESAIADLIDNSLSAGASSVDVQYDSANEPYVAIVDDGSGMSPDELTQAMRHGSRNPQDTRDAADLGRFGLGLKTASLSQCRWLTVVSKKNGVISGRRWDLDVVEDSGRWLVVVPSETALRELPLFRKLEAQANGTLVVWQKLDRLIAGSRSVADEMTLKFSGLFEHLALVFHRFTSDSSSNLAVSIKVNGLRLPHRDPFLKTNRFRQPLEGQVIRHERGTVRVTPYVLPPIHNLSPADIETAGGREGLRGTQGFYIYRNQRLVIWGTWFKLVPKEEFFKLTRVQVDIPNTFDDLWALDIKKSSAQPPETIRNRLKGLIPHFASASRRTITYPGRKTNTAAYAPVWIRTEPAHGKFRYDLNPEHPALTGFSAHLDPDLQRQFVALLDLMAVALPLDGIYADMCGDSRTTPAADKLRELADLASRMHQLTGLPIRQVLDIDPFIRHPELRDDLLAELEN